MSGQPGMPEAVDRWAVSGGEWRVVAVRGDRAVVELLRCDGGEVIETLWLSEERELRWAAAQLSAQLATQSGEPEVPDTSERPEA